MATIATHNGSKVSREHNLRNPKVVTKEAHIRSDGEHETWLDEAPRAAYERIFGEAVKAYNEKQSREDRKISSYYDKIAGDSKKHVVYEMIVGVYGDGISDDVKKQILREHVDGWKQRNPGLELIGAYWHNDEQGGAHVHLDYIPVARNCKRGMKVQTGLKAALGEMGILGDSPKLTAQMLWQRRENETLERICQRHGIQVEHPERGHGAEHLHTEAFKASQEAEKAVQTRDTAAAEAEALRAENEALRASKIASEARTREAEAKCAEAEKAAQRATKRLSDTQKELTNAQARLAAVDKLIDRGNVPVIARPSKQTIADALRVSKKTGELMKEQSNLEAERTELQRERRELQNERRDLEVDKKLIEKDRRTAASFLARAQQIVNREWNKLRDIFSDMIQAAAERQNNALRRWLQKHDPEYLEYIDNQTRDENIDKFIHDAEER